LLDDYLLIKEGSADYAAFLYTGVSHSIPIEKVKDHVELMYNGCSHIIEQKGYSIKELLNRDVRDSIETDFLKAVSDNTVTITNNLLSNDFSRNIMKKKFLEIYPDLKAEKESIFNFYKIVGMNKLVEELENKDCASLVEYVGRILG